MPITEATGIIIEGSTLNGSLYNWSIMVFEMISYGEYMKPLSCLGKHKKT